MSSYILKLTGTNCNIDCVYCNEKSKNLTYNGDVIEQYLHNILYHDDCCDFLLHGGEPLLIGRKRFARILELFVAHRDRINSIKIQTNGTLLSKAWLDMLFKDFIDLNIEISISLDGNKRLNALRRNYTANNSFECVAKLFDLLPIYKKKVGILSVISQAHIGSEIEFMQYFESIKEHIAFMKFNPLYSSREDIFSNLAISSQEYSRFLKTIYRIWIVKRLYNSFVIEPIISYIQAIKGVEVRKYCEFQQHNKAKCFCFTTIYPNADIAPCDTLSINDFKIGNALSHQSISDQVNSFLKQRENIQELLDLQDMCSKCEIYNLCGGGCLSHRKMFIGSKFLEDYCKHRKDMFSFFRSELC